MDVTPRELRDTDIREGFRGYHRDDVDELLERAAATIENLSERVRQLSERMASVESNAGRSRETEEMLQRTLVLAQKTADEAVADAQNRARQLLEESETKARTLVSDAEETARRIAENERTRLEAELLDLAARRDGLSADVDALERFESEHHQRLRSAIEAELDSLGHVSTGMGPKPALHEVELPPVRESVAPKPAPASRNPVRPRQPTVEVGAVDPFPEPPPPAPEPTIAERPSDWGPGLEDPTHSEAVPKPQVDRAHELADFVPNEPMEPEVLDDDAFFASLRDAVRDDAALGPRDDHHDDGPFDEHADSGRKRFRRRR